MNNHFSALSVLLLLLVIAACQQPPVTVTPQTSPPETTTQAVETAVSPTPTSIPLPTPQPTSLPDRALYQSGLVTAAQSSLEQLPHAATYRIVIDVNFEEGQVMGYQIIDYANNEGDPLEDIYFHLLPNLLGGQIEVENVTLNGQPVEPILEEAFDSVMRLPLETPLAPGESIRVEMDFETAVPQQLDRNYGVFAQADDIMALSHFYPMAAVYDESGWNTAPASVQGDPTYGDAAFYQVTVSADEGLVVAGSGVTLQESSAGGRQTLEMAVGPARDFYLAISPRYDVVSRTVGETTINSYAPAEFMAGAADAAAFAADALRLFEARFGPYPYTELDIVATPTLALGIEYPGIIALTLREYDAANPIDPNLPNQVFMETTTAHEVGHQWFYNLVGSDQLDEPWLDEAVTQYVTYLYYLDMYGEDAANGYKESWNGRFERVDNTPIPIGLPVSAYEGAEYSAIVYGRGPLFVEALAQEMSQEPFDAFLADYVAQHQWGIATTASFRQLAEEHCSCDLSALFEEWVYE